jgi:hypothetical protein
MEKNQPQSQLEFQYLGETGGASHGLFPKRFTVRHLFIKEVESTYRGAIVTEKHATSSKKQVRDLKKSANRLLEAFKQERALRCFIVVLVFGVFF